MISQQELQGNWNQFKGQIKNKWGQLTDNDLTQAEGNVERLVGMIQQKTGTARREVEEFFDGCMKEGSKVSQRVAATARDYSQQAGEAISQGYEHVSAGLQEGYDQAGEVIKARPAESLSAAFAAGILAGIVVTLLMRPSR